MVRSTGNLCSKCTPFLQHIRVYNNLAMCESTNRFTTQVFCAFKFMSLFSRDAYMRSFQVLV